MKKRSMKRTAKATPPWQPGVKLPGCEEFSAEDRPRLLTRLQDLRVPQPAALAGMTGGPKLLVLTPHNLAFIAQPGDVVLYDAKGQPNFVQLAHGPIANSQPYLPRTHA